MVLIGLIIIAVVLMALTVPALGIRRKLPVPMPAAGPDRAAPDTEA